MHNAGFPLLYLAWTQTGPCDPGPESWTKKDQWTADWTICRALMFVMFTELTCFMGLCLWRWLGGGLQVCGARLLSALGEMARLSAEREADFNSGTRCRSRPRSRLYAVWGLKLVFGAVLVLCTFQASSLNTQQKTFCIWGFEDDSSDTSLDAKSLKLRDQETNQRRRRRQYHCLLPRSEVDEEIDDKPWTMTMNMDSTHGKSFFWSAISYDLKPNPLPIDPSFWSHGSSSHAIESQVRDCGQIAACSMWKAVPQLLVSLFGIFFGREVWPSGCRLSFLFFKHMPLELELGNLNWLSWILALAHGVFPFPDSGKPLPDCIPSAGTADATYYRTSSLID